MFTRATTILFTLLAVGMCIRQEQKPIEPFVALANKLPDPDQEYPSKAPPPLPPEYEIFDLGTLGGNYSAASAINERREVVGRAETARKKRHAFLWQKGKMTDLGTLGGSSSEAHDINNHGVVVGEALTQSGRTRPFLWRNGRMQQLPALHPGDTVALSINDREEVVGNSWLRVDSKENLENIARGFLYQAGKVKAISAPRKGKILSNGKEITRFGFHLFSEANVINNRGDVGGASNLLSKSAPDNWEQACISFADGRKKQVHYSYFGSRVGAMNDLGDVAGTWTAIEISGVFAVLGGREFAFDPFSEATDMNNQRQIVGSVGGDPAVAEPGVSRAVMWTKEGRQDLTQRIPVNSGWLLKAATGINNRGEIVGWGLHHGKKRAFLLIPLRKVTPPITPQ